MGTRIEIEWTTGPNVNGFYNGTESMVVYGSDFSVYEIEEQLLQRAKRKMMINYLKRTKTTVTEVNT